MYGLAYWFIQSRPAAILAGIVYLYTPYYIILINRLGDLPEIMALGILPAIIYYTLQRYYHPQNNKNLIALSLGIYLFFTIHIITAIYTSFFVIALLFIITIKNKKRWHNLISVGIAYALGCLMAFWFLAPVGLFQKYFLMSETYVDPNYLMLYRPTLSNLLFGAAALTGGHPESALMSIHPSIGISILAAIAICIYALCNKLSSGCRRADYWMPALLIIFSVAFLLVWSPINFWRWLPQVLLVGQYSWRLLSQVIWIGALLFSWSIYWIFKGKLDARHILIGSLLIIIAVNSWFPVLENSKIELQSFIKNPQLVYNGNSMLLNYNLYPGFINHIESIQVDINHTLNTNNIYSIPAPLIKQAVAPVISIKGNIKQNIELTALLNNKPIATKILNAGQFAWTIPLYFSKKESTATLQFITKNNSTIQTIPTQEFLMTGFMNKNEVFDLNQVTPFCKLQKNIKVCQLMVPDNIKLLELPELFYPKLLKITLNGKTIPYSSVIHQGRLLAALIPEAGALNTVTIQFQGLAWGNMSSWLGWGLWFLLVLQGVVHFVLRKNFKKIELGNQLSMTVSGRQIS